MTQLLSIPTSWDGAKIGDWEVKGKYSLHNRDAANHDGRQRRPIKMALILRHISIYGSCHAIITWSLTSHGVC